MLTRHDVETVVEEHICSLLTEAGEEPDDPITGETELHELGINSLTLARLLIALDATFGVDNPFDNNEVLADVRSIGDVVGVYDRALMHAATVLGPQGVL
jgi:acyl carrier protein